MNNGKSRSLLLLLSSLLFIALISISIILIGQQKNIINLEKKITILNTKLNATKNDTTFEKKEDLLLIKANDVLLALKNRDMQKLSSFVHPTRGVRFSPYASVDLKKDLVFSTQKISNLLHDKQSYHWGAFDGSGEPIQLSFEEYYKKFIYDADFINAVTIANNYRAGNGNSIDNIKQAYPNAVFIEYHFPGFDKQYSGIDWKSLRLVFEKKNDIWYLIGIVHDQWTT
jgi:hypothetical protein